MICHFQGGGTAPLGHAGPGRARIARVSGPQRPGAAARAPSGASPPAGSDQPDPVPPDPVPLDPGPLGPVLARLIGRDVTLLAGRRQYAGRLLRAAPVTLVDSVGSVTIINAPVISVAF